MRYDSSKCRVRHDRKIIYSYSAYGLVARVVGPSSRCRDLKPGLLRAWLAFMPYFSRNSITAITLMPFVSAILAKTFHGNAQCLQRPNKGKTIDSPAKFDFSLKFFAFWIFPYWFESISASTAVPAGKMLWGPCFSYFVTFERSSQLHFRRLHIYTKMHGIFWRV